MKRLVGVLLGIVLFMSISVMVHATAIYYSAERLLDEGSNRWQYNYWITNNSIPSGLWGVSVYFEGASCGESFYPNTSPNGWKMDGPFGLENELRPLIMETLTFSKTPLNLGDTLGGFSIKFDWFSSCDPGSQYFTVSSYGNLESGHTQPAPVPEPATLILIGSGLLSFSGLKKRLIK